jgi:putative endonuclease
MANKQNGSLYIGVTANLIRRAWEHKNPLSSCFTKKYKINRLVYYEQYSVITDAIRREKQLKTWPRKWKLELINQFNPQWNDLFGEICG